MKTLVQLIVLSGFFVACSSSDVKVSSVPEGAEVYVSTDGQPPVKVGQTPLSFEGGTYKLNEGSFSQLLVKKEGFQTESVLIPKTLISKKVDLAVKLDKFEVPVKCELQAKDQSKNYEMIASGVARTQLFIQQKNYEQAMNLVMTLITQYPGISVFYDLAGNIHFLSGRFDQAYSSYQTSLNLVPDKTETQRMLDRLQNIKGGRLPAGGNR